MKKLLLILSLGLLTSCFPFLPLPSNPTTSESTSSPTTNTTSETVTTNPTTTTAPTITNPTTEPTSTPTNVTTIITPVELIGIEIRGSMTNKTYKNTDKEWDLTGLSLYNSYSDFTAEFVSELEDIKNDQTFYSIKYSVASPTKGTQKLTITVKDLINDFETSLMITGISVILNDSYDQYYSPDSYSLYDEMPADYHDLQKYSLYDWAYAPSKDKLNVLIIPVAFTNSVNDTEAILNDINTAFSGTEEETGWESVSTYFEKCSYGSFDIDFTVAPEWYQSSLSKNTAGKMSGLDTGKLGQEAVDWYRDNYSNDNCKEFDADENGYIDITIMIYAEHNYQTAGNNNSNFWAYCFSKQGYDMDTESPNVNNFLWASYDFMYSVNGAGSKNIKIDAHSYIHEFGHALGLDDYYNYNGGSSPAGEFDMQDNNVGDHNSFSKFALGWSKPYVVYGNSEITLKSSALYENQSILIPAGGFDEWNGSPFDEYILLDFYTPEGLNEFDVKHKYDSQNIQGPDAYGIRAYHIDARLYNVLSFGSSFRYDKYIDKVNSKSLVVVAANNTDGGSYATKVTEAQDFKLLHLLSATKNDRFSKSVRTFQEDDLFQEGDVFTMNDFKSYFVNSGLMNDEQELGFSFEITKLNHESVTVKITKD